MTPSGLPVCSCCGARLPGAFDAVVECSACRTARPVFDMARAPWLYAGAAQEAVKQFKYHGRWRLGRRLAQDMAKAARASFPLDDVAAVVPVPLHWLKRRLRGFNSVEQLARTVAGSLKKSYASSALQRTRWTVTQTRLGSRQRVRNVHRAFAARTRLVDGKTVLLIDDVLTSGATANACALALKDAGARAVFVLTAARTPLA